MAKPFEEWTLTEGHRAAAWKHIYMTNNYNTNQPDIHFQGNVETGRRVSADQEV